MSTLADKIRALVAADAQPVGVVVVDHGSRRGESNDLLLAAAELFRVATELAIVEPAHMELAEPSIAQAFDACVARGARTVVVFPYFLSPGRHWSQDIPRLATEAAGRHPDVKHLVTAPLGLHPLIAEVMAERIVVCLAHQTQGTPSCEVCNGEAHCMLR